MKRKVPHPDRLSASTSIAPIANNILAFANVSSGFPLLYYSCTLVLNHG